jgi:hypothetical protein
VTRGGKREGAGRKRGTSNKKTAARREKLVEATASIVQGLTPAAAALMTPYQVVALVMQTYLLAGDLVLAHAVAMDLMPYCLPKLTPAAANAPSDLDPAMMTASQRATEIRQLQAKPKRVVH